jgi:hypothetical protein
MKVFLFFCVCFFSFQVPVFAQIEVTPNQLPSQYPSPQYIPAYCLFKLEVLSSNKDIYACNYVTNTVYTSSSSQLQNQNSLYSYCWSTFSGSTNQSFNAPVAGIVLKKQVFTSFTIPESYDFNAPCKLKSEAEPDQICNQSLDVNGLVRSAFGQRFPLDLFEGFQPPSFASSCPNFTITGQTFQLCYLNDLVASLKYVLLIVFIITSVMSL